MNQENLRKITELRHVLHQHPELSMQEIHTKETLKQFIQENTSLKTVDCGHWFWCEKEAEQKEEGHPVLAFRADFDALPINETAKLDYASLNPGCSHKCGHDGHASALAGLALELDQKKDLKNDVCLIFQHAEEIGIGGKEASKLLREKGVDEVYAFHSLSGYPEGTVLYRPGLSQPASIGFTVSFEGMESHASDPEEGRNPGYAIADLVEELHRLLALPHKGMVLGTIININVGTRNFGVSAGKGELSLTLRAEEETEMNQLEEDLKKAAIAYAERDGLNVSFSESDPFPETRNNPDCLQKVLKAAETAHLDTLSMPKLWRASEDFGWYLKRCPGAIFYLGNGVNYPPLHTPDFDFIDRNLERAVNVFLNIIALS